MVDDNVWEEIRNFKKCLIMMFAKQEKGVVFFETVVELSRQRRHCLVECIPLPRDLAEEAPMYFKKVWSLFSLSIEFDRSLSSLSLSHAFSFSFTSHS